MIDTQIFKYIKQQLEYNIKEEEIKNKIGLESLSILRSEVNQFLGLLQSYNNEIMQSPKHQQIVQQKLLAADQKNLQLQENFQNEKLKDEVENIKKQERGVIKNWRNEYNQKLEEYLDDHKDMDEIFIAGKNLNDTYTNNENVNTDKYNSQNNKDNMLIYETQKQLSDKKSDKKDKVIQGEQDKNNKQYNLSFEQKRDIQRRNDSGNICFNQISDAEIKQYQIKNDCQNESNLSSYVENDNDIQQSRINHQQYQLYRQSKINNNQGNFNNLSIIFSESEKSSPQLKQSTESTNSQQSSSNLCENNNEGEYEIQEKIKQIDNILIDKIENIKNNQQKSNFQNKGYCFTKQVNQNTQQYIQQTIPFSTQQSNGSNHFLIQKDQIQNQNKNKLFGLDTKDIDGIAEELFKHTEYLQKQINQANCDNQIQTSVSVAVNQEKQKNIPNNENSDTISIQEQSKKPNINESLLYLQEAFELCLQDMKAYLNSEHYKVIEQKLKSVQSAYHSHVQLEIERAQILEKKNQNLNKNNHMIVQALQATKEEINQLIQNYHILSEDHVILIKNYYYQKNELLLYKENLIENEKKYIQMIEKTEKERKHLKYLILVANEKYEKTDDKCNQLMKKNTILTDQISSMQTQFSIINQNLKGVIVNLQDTKDTETHHILQQILKETHELINKKYSHSPNASCSVKQSSVRENSLGKKSKTRSSSPIRDAVSPPSKANILNHASSSYFSNSLKQKENKLILSQQGIGVNQAQNINKTSAQSTQYSSKNGQVSQQPQQLNQSSGCIKQKENINRIKTPPKVIQKQILPARSKEDQRKIEETYRQIFLKQLKQAKNKESN